MNIQFYINFISVVLNARTLDFILLFILVGGLSAISTATFLIAKKGEIFGWVYAVISFLGVASCSLHLPTNMLDCSTFAIISGVLVSLVTINITKFGARNRQSINALTVAPLFHR